MLRVRVSSKINGTFRIVDINSDVPVPVENEYFKGYLFVRVKNFHGSTEHRNQIHNAFYFQDKKRSYSIQIEGQFKQEVNGNDLVLAADFEKPIAPPFGLDLLVKFAKMIDPGLNVNLTGTQRPTVFSHVLCAMNVIKISKTAHFEDVLKHSAGIKEDMSLQSPELKGVQEHKRRKFFLDEGNRRNFVFNPELHYSFDWFSPYINWNTFELHMGIRIGVKRFLNSQPVRFIGRNKQRDGRVYFVVEFELV